MTSVWGVIPAAGSGSRMAAEVPKQYLEIAGTTLLEHTVQALLACPDLRGLVVVLDPSDRRADSVASLSDPRVMRVAGGAERADSVLAGLDRLAEIAGADDWVLVHDAARPCLPVAVAKTLIDTVLASNEGAILAQRMTDTVKRVNNDGSIVETLDRNALWRAQTPQMFRLEDLRRALREAIDAGVWVTDEAMVMEAAGFPVRVVEGPASNIKVTVPEDLRLAELFLESRLERI
ncbi:MAG: 2-C-methyl-D-erythritol 4-phosphate cytidylyltransferase [Halieaceae bacterium]|jgi:2-C-methyl-D-erythritol 4-phosphate cytidylyltransferase|nr:2-C-methyl-D-erythritol 4-phosphate cytidylyltransferase [Halieaceae bacterium]